MESLSYTFYTQNRNEFINVCAKLTAFLDKKIQETPNRPINIEITGDYASGKSLVADAIKASLMKTEVEDPSWKHIDNENTELNGLPISISFVNARFDSLNVIFKRAKLKRDNTAGIMFISNKPRFNLASFFTKSDISKPDLSIDVTFPDGEAKPKQCGPIKIGTQSEMRNRVITISSPDSFTGYSADKSCNKNETQSSYSNTRWQQPPTSFD